MIPNTISRTIALFSFAFAFAVSPAGAAPRYTAIALDPVLPFSSYSTSINASGDVAGEFWDWDAGDVAFRYIGGVMQVLGTMDNLSSGNGIDDDGQVAVDSWGTGHAYLWSGNSMRDLGTLGGQRSTPSGISADGQVTGYSMTSAGVTHAFRYANGVMQDLGTLGGMDSGGVGINQSGDVTGWLNLPDGSYRAFIHSQGVMRALGTFSGDGYSYGSAINALGQVTGSASVDGAFMHAFLYTNGTMLDLGTVRDDNSIGNSVGSAINALGDVTGNFNVATGDFSRAWNSDRAFLYTDGTMYDLNSLVISGLEGFTLIQARGINDHRQIAATGCNGQVCRAFRLDPVPGPPTPAVEYHHAAFNHYFLTANPNEIAALDNGAFPGWARTGQTFNVYVDAPVGTSATCRFFSAAFTSHFYTAYAGECAYVKTDPNWQFEGIAFNIAVPDQNGSCPSTTQPVYRLYNNGQGAAPNHRFTTSLATRSQMVGAGWVPEGDGPLGVAMCAPQ